MEKSSSRKRVVIHKNMMSYFGTDGIRAIANKHPLTPQSMVFIGKGVARYLLKCTQTPSVVIGMDPRESSSMLLCAIASGMMSEGVDVVNIGIAPTPMVAFSVLHGGFDMGIVISASHNSFDYNGVKFFGPHARKISIEQESELESLFIPTCAAPNGCCGIKYSAQDFSDSYVSHLCNLIGDSLGGTRVVLDCANGACSGVAASIFKKCGAEVVCEIGVSPDGKNINYGVGSCHTEKLSDAVLAHSADIGISFDGDGDRTVLIDGNGIKIDGDQIIAFLLGSDSQDIVGTILSNLGLERYVVSVGAKFHRADVGDRFVSEMMDNVDAKIGGEPCGHIILSEHMPTGDGIFTAISVVKKLCEIGVRASDTFPMFSKVPQVIRNIKNVQDLSCINEKIASYRAGFNGRIIVRKSGTEPVLRIMVEGECIDEANRLADDIIIG